MADAAHTEFDEDVEFDEEPQGSRIGRILGGAAGAISLVGGLTWILINLHAPEPVTDLLVGVVLTAGGLILLMPHRVRLPRAAGWITAAATGLIGSAAGLVVFTRDMCCQFVYVEARGFPFRWLSHGGSAADPDTARRLAATDSWQADVPSLLMNVVVWAYAGILVLALINGLRNRR